MTKLLARLLAKVLDVDIEEQEEDSKIIVTYATAADYKSDIIQEDGSSVKVNYEELDKRTEDDPFMVNDREAPRCYFCMKVAPEFVWHNRYYCRECMLKREVMTAELSPSILKEEYPVGILILKDNSRLPFRWHDDVLWEFRKARKVGGLFTVTDPDGGEVSIIPSFVKAIKKPLNLYQFKWSEPDIKRPKIVYKVQEG